MEKLSTLRSEVYRALRRDLLDCKIRPGSEIREPELSERFAVSKSPVRDALLRLEAEGLVVVRPRKGYRAAAISMSDARDLFDFRALLEGECVKAAASLASVEHLAALDRFRSLELFHGQLEPAASFVVYNREFHVALASLCTNRRLRDAACDIVEQFDRLVTVSVQAVSDVDRSVLIKEHCGIIDALQARDGKTAARILSLHVGAARKRVLGALACAAILP